MTLWIGGAGLDLPAFNNPVVVSTWLRLLGFRATWRNADRIPDQWHVYSTANLPLLLRPAVPKEYEKLAKEGATSDADLASTGRAGNQAGRRSESVHIFPEGGLTNGRHSMMQFARGFMKFANGHPVVPVALKTTCAFGIRTHTLTSSFPANFFWVSFCPWVETEAVVLPPMVPFEGEGKGAFVKRVQQAIADELDVGISGLTIREKRKMIQREGTS
eukprot:gene28382-31517_t